MFLLIILVISFFRREYIFFKGKWEGGVFLPLYFLSSMLSFKLQPGSIAISQHNAVARAGFMSASRKVILMTGSNERGWDR